MTTLPFTDVMGNIFFCQIAEAYISGLTNGTSATTYSPSDPVPREQMAAFVTRTQDSALRRGSRRAALEQWSTPGTVPLTGRILVGNRPRFVKSDGADLWVAVRDSNSLARVRASDGNLLASYELAFSPPNPEPNGVLVARGRIYVIGAQTLDGSS